jgi:hypothetical protein
MVDELSITDDGKVSLTTAELDMLENLLAAHDRGGFYMAYNAITDSAEAALQSKHGAVIVTSAAQFLCNSWLVCLVSLTAVVSILALTSAYRVVETLANFNLGALEY